MVNAEFNWWLLIVGLVIGAGLVWVILADSSRRDADITARERPSEALWIAEALRRSGRTIDVDDVHEVLDLHEAYRSLPPPDELPVEEDDADAAWIDDAGPDGAEPDRASTAPTLAVAADRGDASAPRASRPAMAHPASDRDADADRQPV